MIRPLRFLLASLAGLALGWASAAWLKKAPAPPRETPPPATAADRPTRPSRRADRTDLPDVEACRALLLAASTPDDRHPLLRRFDRERAFLRWLALDPESALAEAALSPTSDFARDLWQTWAAFDPPGALGAFMKTNGDLAGDMATGFFVTLMKNDPALTAQTLFDDPRWLEQIDASHNWHHHSTIIDAWMLADPAAAVAFITALGPDAQVLNSNKTQNLARMWAKHDFAAAWEHYMAAALQEKSDRLPWGAQELLAEGIRAGSEEALRILQQIPASTKSPSDLFSDTHGRIAYWEIAYSIASANPHQALELARSLSEDGPFRSELLATAARKFASSDPALALALMNESGVFTKGLAYESLLRESFASLAGTDPRNAAAQVATLPENQRQQSMTGVLTRLFAEDPSAAIEQSRAWLADPKLAAQLPAAWAESFSWSHGSGVRDPGEMLAAIPELNQAVDGNVLSTWTKAAPEAAAAWIAERLEQGENIPLGNRDILADFAISRPEFTAAWLPGLPEGEFRTQAANTLVANWAAFDPAAARAWIESLPQGGLRQSAERGLERVSNPR